jgi:hypothetical protein
MEVEIAKLVADIFCNKKIAALTPKEKELVKLLEQGGYVKAASHGFVGPCTDKVPRK